VTDMNSSDFLLPSREKVAPEGRRMRGLTDMAAMCGIGGRGGATPHPSASTTPSPARGEGWSVMNSGVETFDVR